MHVIERAMNGAMNIESENVAVLRASLANQLPTFDYLRVAQ